MPMSVLPPRGLIKLGNRAGLRVSGGGFRFQYSVDFSALPDGELPARWTGATYAINSGEAINTPTLGTELLTNGNMETGSPPTGWGTSGATVTAAADERTGGSGAQSLNVARNGADYPSSGRTVTTVLAGFYLVTAWMRRVDSTNVSIQLTNNTVLALATLSPDVTATTWTAARFTGRAIDTTSRIFNYLNAAGLSNGVSGRFDDLSVKRITHAELFSTIESHTADVNARAAWAIAIGCQAGVVVNLDSTSNPQNFVIGLFDRARNRVMLEKYVAGTPTRLIDEAGVYSAGTNIEVRKSGTTYQIFYNNVQVGTDQTVSDAGIISNTLHGLFSTDGGNSAQSFFVEAA